MWELLRGLRKQESTLFLTLTGILLSILLVGIVACGGGETPQKTEEKTEPKTVKKPVETPVPTPVEKTEPEVPPVQDKVAHISDIHFNPFYDTALMPRLMKYGADQWEQVFASSTVKGYGTYGKNETNYNLLKVSLENMAAVYKKPDFVIFTGDFIAHEFHDRYKTANNGSLQGLDFFIKKTVTFMVLMFKKHFPGVPVYFSLGNNDSYGGDYLLEPDGQFLKDTTSIVSVNWLYSGANKTSFSTTYPIGGYYTVAPPKIENARVISLNTIFFSVKFQTDFTRYDPAEKQLEWFEAQLKSAKAKNENVWLLLHIPPGTNVYSTVHDNQYKSFWKTAYNAKFLQLVTTYSSVFTAGYAGHTHMDDFRLVFHRSAEPITAAMFIHICPAVSPQFDNNPGFRSLDYTPGTFSVNNYAVYYLDLGLENPGEWSKEYSFNENYGQTGVNAAAMQAVYTAIKDDMAKRADYMNYYDVNHRQALTPENFNAYWCGIGNLQQDDFEECNKAGNQ